MDAIRPAIIENMKIIQTTMATTATIKTMDITMPTVFPMVMF